MRIDIVSLFPGIISGCLGESIMGRALRHGLVEINAIDLRSYSHDRRGTVDDSPYGGGAGMVLAAGPLFECISSLRQADSRVILMCPQGRRFSQCEARRLSGFGHIIFVCGHYEGLDERARQVLFDDELSLGDFVLTNGALAAVVMTDAIVRLLPGVLGCDASSEEESFGDMSLLEYPQYTRPESYSGLAVPSVLLSGDHEEMCRWRLEQRVIRTASRRPDLLSKISEEDR